MMRSRFKKWDIGMPASWKIQLHRNRIYLKGMRFV